MSRGEPSITVRTGPDGRPLLSLPAFTASSGFQRRAMLVGARSDFEGCINGLDIKFEGRGSSVVCTIWYNEQLPDDADAADDFAAELAELFSVPEDVMAEFSNTSGAHADDDAEAGALPSADVTVEESGLAGSLLLELKDNISSTSTTPECTFSNSCTQ